jgi:HEAT repeat protein
MKTPVILIALMCLSTVAAAQQYQRKTSLATPAVEQPARNQPPVKPSWGAKVDQLVPIITLKTDLPASDVVNVLANALADNEHEVRRAALDGVTSQAAAPRFVASAQVRDRWRSDHVAIKALRAPVASLLTDPDWRIREAAVRALVALDFDLDNPLAMPSAETEVELIRAFNLEANGNVRGQILSNLLMQGRRASPELQRLLITAFTDQSSQVRYAATKAFDVMNPGIIGPQLTQLLNDESWNVREAAAQGLQRINSRAALPALRAALSVEQNPQVLLAVQRAIAQIENSSDPRK